MRGYLRPDGRVGIRNHIAVMYTRTDARHVAEQIALRVPGAEVFGLDIHFDPQSAGDLAALASHPNVSSVIVVGTGLEGEVLDVLMQQVAERRKPVAMISILEDGGTLRSIQKGVKIGLLFCQEAQSTQRVPISLADLTIGVVSDSNTGDALNPAVAWAVGRITARKGTVVFAPKPDSVIMGGHQMLAAGCGPAVPGLYWVDVQKKQALSLLIQSGAHLIVLITRMGSTAGSVITPVIKIATDAGIYQRFSDDLDIDAGQAVEGTEAVFEIGQAILEKLIDIAAGEPTQAEVLGHKEFWG